METVAQLDRQLDAGRAEQRAEQRAAVTAIAADVGIDNDGLADVVRVLVGKQQDASDGPVSPKRETSTAGLAREGVRVGAKEQRVDVEGRQLRGRFALLAGARLEEAVEGGGQGFAHGRPVQQRADDAHDVHGLGHQAVAVVREAQMTFD